MILEKIIIKNLEIMAKHGVNPAEKEQKQRFLVSCKIYMKSNKAFFCDDLEKTVDYSKVCRNIKNTVENNTFDLIERLSQEVSKNLFEEFEIIKKLKITVKKPEAPIGCAKIGCVGVKIKRKRGKFNA